jgi:hypothetical protein
MIPENLTWLLILLSKLFKILQIFREGNPTFGSNFKNFYFKLKIIIYFIKIIHTTNEKNKWMCSNNKFLF